MNFPNPMSVFEKNTILIGYVCFFSENLCFLTILFSKNQYFEAEIDEDYDWKVNRRGPRPFCFNVDHVLY